MLERREDTYRTAVAIVTHTRDYRSEEVIPALTRHGFAATGRPFDDATHGLFKSLNPDLVVLAIDPLVPTDEALIRETSSSTNAAIVVLIPGPTNTGLMEALDAGADVCLRDSDPVELFSANLSALFRRRMPIVQVASRAQARTVQLNDLSLDLEHRRVTRGDTALALTTAEFRVLACLAKNASRAVSPVELLRAMQDEEASGRDAEDIVKAHIRRLRRKIEAQPGDASYIVNVRGFGYMLDCQIQRSTSETASSGLQTVAS